MRSVWWESGTVRLLDQTQLPREAVVRTCRTWAEVAEAIRTLQVRGAPAIGAAAAYALALAAHSAAQENGAAALPALRAAGDALISTRPTAVNLRWAVERMLDAAERTLAVTDLPSRLLREAEAIAEEDVRANRAIADYGGALVEPGERILTYCNTGSLATVEGGTAYGILRRAHELGKRISVYACETRPVLQGARLTTWELLRDGIPATLVTDNAAGSLMARGEIDRVIVGADRVVQNGDVANKIGTYTLAVLARAHEIPFVVAAPLSTVDVRISDGSAIPIEERPADEVRRFGDSAVAPDGIPVRNIAFDVTPNHLVTVLVTEAGVIHPPFEPALMRLLAARTGASR